MTTQVAGLNFELEQDIIELSDLEDSEEEFEKETEEVLLFFDLSTIKYCSVNRDIELICEVIDQSTSLYYFDIPVPPPEIK